eukprot:3772434-Prymnesium_polylepis.1
MLADTEARLRMLAERRNSKRRGPPDGGQDRAVPLDLLHQTEPSGVRAHAQEEQTALQSARPCDPSSGHLYFDPLHDIPSDVELQHDEEPPELFTEAPELRGFFWGFFWMSFADEETEATFLANQFDGSFSLRMLGMAMWFNNRVGSQHYTRYYGAPESVVWLDRVLCFVVTCIHIAAHSPRIITDRPRARKI